MPDLQVIEWVREKYVAIAEDLDEREGGGVGRVQKHVHLAGEESLQYLRQPEYLIEQYAQEFRS